MVPDRLRNRMARTRRTPSELASLRQRVLSENDLFGDNAEIRDRLSTRKVAAGEVIYDPGQTGNQLFIVRSGQVSIYRLGEDGRKLVLETVNAGDAFGELPLLGETMGGSFAEAAEDSEIASLTPEELQQFMQDSPDVAVTLVNLLSQRLQDMEARLQEVAFRTVPARLAALLLRLSDEHHDVRGLSHQELAEMVGTSRETVSRALLDFKAAGLVDIGRRAVHIRDAEALRAALTPKNA